MTTHVPAKVQVGRFFRTVIPAVLVVLGAVALGLGLVVYGLTHPADAPDLVGPSSYLIPSVDVSWPTEGAGELGGWWIPGRRGGPAVVLVPGYGMGRSDVLSLASALHNRGFHVLAFDMRGQGAAPRHRSTLGLEETADVLSAIDYVRARPETDNARLGIWGVDVGARAALDAAGQRPEVRALALDSAFDTVAEFFSIRLQEDLGAAARFVEFAALPVFRAYMMTSGASLDRRLQLERISDRSILFLLGENRKALARAGESLYNRLEPRKELVSLPGTRVRVMAGDDLKNYDRQVANFFYLNLPVSGDGPGDAMSRVAK